MSNNIRLEEKQVSSLTSSGAAVQTDTDADSCKMQGNGWLGGGLTMAICCAAPVLLVSAVTLMGISLGALAGGALSLVALLACPVGMYLMMRMMAKEKK
jgi:hypothetical protein